MAFQNKVVPHPGLGRGGKPEKQELQKASLATCSYKEQIAGLFNALHCTPLRKCLFILASPAKGS